MQSCIERVCNTVIGALLYIDFNELSQTVLKKATLTSGPTFLSPPPGLCRTVFFFLSAIVAAWRRLQRKHNNSPPFNLRNINWRVLLFISSSCDLRGKSSETLFIMYWWRLQEYQRNTFREVLLWVLSKLHANWLRSLFLNQEWCPFDVFLQIRKQYSLFTAVHLHSLHGHREEPFGV